jgi:2-isopropylmalate synthase
MGKSKTDIKSVSSDKNEADHIIIFDTTLRDGEQSPGASMSQEEKIQVAEVLDEMGVDVIEAGFPVASPGDFESVKQISKIVKTASVCGLSRASLKDIDRAGQALRDAVNPRIHTFLSTSDLHMKYKLQMTREEVLEAVTASVTHARSYTDNVEWSAEDATRTDHDFLCRCVEAAIKAGAGTINIPDTLGYTVPEEYIALFTMIQERVPGTENIILSTHCHNDLGMAVANSLASITAGVRQIECTINGLGERAGNTALEEVVMAIRTRNDILPYWTNIDTTMITRVSKLVSAVTAFPMQPNKAIVGKNAFAHESGIHQDGMLKNSQTYEIMTPASVGLKASSLVMGKHSGRHAFKVKLKDLGYSLPDKDFQDAFKRFKDLADHKKHVFDEDIEALVDDQVAQASEKIKVVALTVIAGTGGPQKATITLDIEGHHETRESTGEGPVDSIFNAIKEIVNHDARLALYEVSAVTAGTDAQAEVMVRLSEDRTTVTGRSADQDTMVASAKAYVSAVNKLRAKHQKKETNVDSDADAVIRIVE